MDDTAYLDMPVTQVTWDQAQAYCTWMGGHLPTEAQWEIAARGSTNNTYPWGNTKPSCGLSNVNKCTAQISPVTSFIADASPFGVLDLGGNVSEWVNDYYQADYFKNAPSVDPQGPADGDYKIVRGGSFASSADNAVVYSRALSKPSIPHVDIGFRCAVSTPKDHAPYCGAAPNINPTSNAASQPTRSCVPSVNYDLRYFANNNMMSGNVTGGRLVSIGGPNIDCSISDNYFSCVPANAFNRSHGYYHGSIVRVCVACSVPLSPAASDLSCPLNYQNETNGTYCEYKGGGAGNCPAGSTPLNQNQCIYQTQQTGGCPLGSYLDQGTGSCVTVERADTNCLSGFNYLGNTSCCSAPSKDSSDPQCQSGEYYDYQLGCVPLPQTGYPQCRSDEYYNYQLGCVPLAQAGTIQSCITVQPP